MGLWSKVDQLPKAKHPSFSKVWNSYPVSDPCNRARVQWQCAVYLSATLAKSGIIGKKGFDGSQGYDNNPVCPGIKDFKGLNLARGSQTLADYLHHRLFPPAKYSGGIATRNSLKNRKGIIFFKHISGFTSQGGGQGSHIDLWNGPNIQLRRDPFKLGEYFNDAKAVYFWRLN